MDYPYIVLLFILLVLAFLELQVPATSKKYFTIACLVAFLFVGLRAPVVGADTWNYYRYAIGVRNYYNNDQRALEPLYVLYNSFFRNVVPVGLVFMLVNTLIIFAPIRYILNKYVKYKTFGVLVFFLIYQFSPFFVALRQVLALSFVLWGVVFVLQSNARWIVKWIVFCALSTIAYFFHTTAFVAALLFIAAYVFPLKKRWVAIIAIIVSAIVGIVLQKFDILSAFQFLLSLNVSATERLQGYFENEELNDLSTLNITLRTSIVAIVAFAFMARDKVNHWFSKIYIIGVILYNLFISVPMISRMVLANTLFVIFVLPLVFEGEAYLNPKIRLYIKVLMVLIVLYFTRSFVISNSEWDRYNLQRMHPYYFFFQDYRDHPTLRYF